MSSHRNLGFRMPSARRTAATVLVLLATFLVFTQSAWADHRRDVDVEFTQLDSEIRHGELVVHYEIDRHDWRQIRRNHIEPRLNMYGADSRHGAYRFRASAELFERRGTVVFSRSVIPGFRGAVEYRLVGHTRRARIDDTIYGESCSSRVRVAVAVPREHRHHHHHPPAGPSYAEIVAACDDVTTFDDDLQDCVSLALAIPVEPLEVVGACGAATTFSKDLNACLANAAGLVYTPVATIRACDAATHFGEDLAACVRSASAYRSSAAGVIRACDEATDFRDDFGTCVAEGARLGYRAVSVVEACDAATTFDRDFEQCLAGARRRG